MSLFGTKRQFSSNFAGLSSVMKVLLFHLKLYRLSAKATHQKQIFRLCTARMTINQIFYVIFQTTRQFSLWTKRVYQSTFECFNDSSPNFSCQFRNHKIKVYSNFASLFSVMKYNSSVFFFFLSQTFVLWKKRALRKEIFRLLSG